MRRAALLIALGLGSAALAHKASDSYLNLDARHAQLQGHWDIALRDLDFAVGLDTMPDGALTWGELRARTGAVRAYAFERLALSADGQPCPLQPGAVQVDTHSDGAYAVLHFTATCPQPPQRLGVGYRLLSGLDPQHRGLLGVRTASGSLSAVLRPDAPEQVLSTSHPAPLIQFVQEGIRHIWQGLDHVLFLLALLLPAVLRRTGGHWEGVPTLRGALRDVATVVTSFTLAHSLTLALASLQFVSLPSRTVEALIAASVVVAALNNVFPALRERRRALVAFAFGLVHGFGFAAALGDLGLPQEGLLRALLGFNLGVELGQLAIVTAFVPLAFLVRRSLLYRRVVLTGGSLGVAALAAVWFAQRAFVP